MIRLIQYLFYGHIHKWKILQKENCKVGEYSVLRYTLQCEHCGELKAKRIN